MRLLLIHLILPQKVCDTISASSSRSDRYPQLTAQIPPGSAAGDPLHNWASAADPVPYAASTPTSRLHNAPFRYVVDKSRTAWSGEGSVGRDLLALTRSMKHTAASV